MDRPTGKEQMPLERPIKDFMHPIEDYPKVNEEATIHDALQQLEKAKQKTNRPCLLIAGLDTDGETAIKGFVTFSDVVYGISGHFLKGAQKTGPIFWEGQFNSEIQLALQSSVLDIMTPAKICITEDNMLMEAVFLLHKYKMNLLPVLQKEEVTGLIHLEDIFHAISRMGNSA